jgi:Leucine-rich repeat (LRR) protein
MRSLFLGRNVIEEISGLDTLLRLEALDLSDNYIEHISGLSGLPCLKTLNLSGNKMRTLASVEHLAQCSALISLDMASCKLEEPEVVPMLVQLPLALLRLQGNPLVGKVRCAPSKLLLPGCWLSTTTA